MDVYTSEITGKHSKKREKQLPTESQNSTKYRNVS